MHLFQSEKKTNTTKSYQWQKSNKRRSQAPQHLRQRETIKEIEQEKLTFEDAATLRKLEIKQKSRNLSDSDSSCRIINKCNKYKRLQQFQLVLFLPMRAPWSESYLDKFYKKRDSA